MNSLAETTGTSAPARPMYEIEGASFAVAGRTLLHPLSLTPPAQRVCRLIGHNGSDKSTLLKLLARQQRPSTGSVRFAGTPLAQWDNRALARKVANLPQQPPAADGMTVRELVSLGRYPWHDAVGRFGVRDSAKVAEAMELTDVVRFAGRPVEGLYAASSGASGWRCWSRRTVTACYSTNRSPRSILPTRSKC